MYSSPRFNFLKLKFDCQTDGKVEEKDDPNNHENHDLLTIPIVDETQVLSRRIIVTFFAETLPSIGDDKDPFVAYILRSVNDRLQRSLCSGKY